MTTITIVILWTLLFAPTDTLLVRIEHEPGITIQAGQPGDCTTVDTETTCTLSRDEAGRITALISPSVPQSSMMTVHMCSETQCFATRYRLPENRLRQKVFAPFVGN